MKAGEKDGRGKKAKLREENRRYKEKASKERLRAGKRDGKGKKTKLREENREKIK